MIRIVIADDHTLVRTGMRLLLESLPDVIVVGEAGDGVEALRLIELQRPDVAFMDLVMPKMGGLEAIRSAAAQFPDTRIVVLSMHAEEAYLQEALAAGALGYLLKGSDRSELESALRSVMAGVPYLTPAISHSIVAALGGKRSAGGASAPLASLTPRQQQVLKLVAEGLSNKQTAARLHLSAKSVEAHRSAIMQRLKIRDVAGLVRFAIKTGLVRGV
jgi:DNA-binding NarL/FixJ family response regulator